jgi:hypothetical protein
VALVPLGCLPLVWALVRRERLDGRVVALGLLALFFLALFIRSRRFVEYEPAFATLFCAFAWSHQVPDRARAWVSQRLAPPARWLVLGLALCGAVLVLRPMLEASREMAATARSADTYRGSAAWLVANTLPGERVFTTDWDDFPLLFFHNTHNTYLVGLDPTYMHQYDPELYQLWRTITRGGQPQPGALIRERFGSLYVLTDLNHFEFIDLAAQDPQMREVYRDATSVVYAVAAAP